MFRPVPKGFYRVSDGEIRPDDLCLSVMTGEWLRFDSDQWTGPLATVAEEAFMVVRKARHFTAAGQQERRYAIARSEEPPADCPPTVIDDLTEPPQGSLF